MTLYLPGRLLDEIRSHSVSVYPEECCGFLLGRLDDGYRVEEVLRAMNTADGPRTVRYSIDPGEIIAAERRASSAGRTVIGYYHSHPDHPSVPSEFDRSHAWPSYSYLIMRVVRGEPADFRSWRLASEGLVFSREDVEIV